MMGAVAFDLDGVLIDSEPLYFSGYSDLFERVGVPYDDVDLTQMLGLNARSLWSLMSDKFDLSFDVDQLVSMDEDMKYEILNSGAIALNTGVGDTMEFLAKSGIVIGIVSSAPKRNIATIVSRFEIGSLVADIVGGDEVVYGKPNPDCYLLIAERLSIQPHRITAIEDSTFGIRAAKSAAMNCIAYAPDRGPYQDTSMADLVINEFSRNSCYQIASMIRSTNP